MSQSQLDKVVGYYVRHACHSGVTDQEELAQITEAIKMNILKETLPQISESMLSEAKQKVEEEAKQYRKKLFQRVKVSLIIETIFIAFLVGIIVNQVTNLIPDKPWLVAPFVIIGSLAVCILMIFLAAAGSKE